MAELTVPLMSFSALGQLGNVYREAQDKQGLKEAFAGGIGSDPQSLAALAQRVAPYNPQLGVNLAQLAHTYTRQGTQDARQQGLDQFNQNIKTQELELERKRINAGLDKTPPGFQRSATGGYEPIPGGPADPNYIAKKTSITAIPDGFQRDDATGGLKPIPGGPNDPNYLRTKGDRQNAPSGYQWNDPGNPSAGMTAIPGGPAEKVDAEVAARLGLAKSFLGELPQIKERIAAGGLSGPVDTAAAMAGMGPAGELRRKMDSGAEALLRMLTGAGMNKDEAAEYVRRYKFNPKTDLWGGGTALSKMEQLERELNTVGETVGKGRGGWQSPSKTQPETAKQDDKGFRTAPPKIGELRGGYRFKGGNPGDPANWAKAQDVAAPGFSDRFDSAFRGGNGS